MAGRLQELDGFSPLLSSSTLASSSRTVISLAHSKKSKQTQTHGPPPGTSVLTRLRFSDASYTPSPASVVYRSDWDGNVANAENLWHDVAAAFNLALRWKISSDTTFADTASNILHAWATKLTALGGGDDKYLTAGLQGYQLANAAELLRDYEPFATKVLPSVIDMANTVFLPMHYKWLRHEEPSQHNTLHFFANWELCNVASAMAMGVLTDHQTYWARYNLGHDDPFVPYSNGIVSFTELSSASRGAMRPTWELLYNHYVTIKGMDAPWTTKFLNESLNYYGGAEGGAGSWAEGSGHYDGLGWGSLLHRLDKEDVAAQGSGADTLIASPNDKATSKLPQSTPDASRAGSSGANSTSMSTSVASSTPTPLSSPSSPLPGTSTPASTPDSQPTPRPPEAGQKPSHRAHRHCHHGHKHGRCHAQS
ncbi:hypothetical protein BA78_8107 [Aspergillus fumigatus]|nr:hypothetical protein BA78_8107 [Aspergillus fumigatus]